MWSVHSFAVIFLSLLSTAYAQHGPVAIEVRFERLENPIAIRDDGRRCDVMSNCDMRVQFHVDTESATMPWPGAKKDISTWYLVDLPANTNMVSLFKTLVARRVSNEYKVDNENKLLVNFRILAEDRDVFTHYDIIERFDCPFSGIPANADKQAEWHPPRDQSPMQCHGEIHYGRPVGERPTIYFRWRIYKTEPDTADAAQNTSGWQRIKQMFANNHNESTVHQLHIPYNPNEEAAANIPRK